ncbi:MAG: hypothetical protein SOR72_06195 [Hornefia sp.]|nr:hypothetical protein [Hornefia sp.]
MTRRDLFMSIIFTAVIPLFLVGNGIREMSNLIKSEHISEREIFYNTLDTSGGSVTSTTLILLILIPMVVVVFEYIKGDDRVNCVVRHKNRDTYTKSLIVDGIKYSVCVVLLMEILKIFSLVFFLGLQIIASKTLGIYLLIDIFASFLFYFRAISIYLLCKAKLSNKNISIIVTVLVYFTECVIFNYVLYQTELLPAFTLMISFYAILGGINPVLSAVWMCVSLFMNIVLALLLIIEMRGKDILSFEK